MDRRRSLIKRGVVAVENADSYYVSTEQVRAVINLALKEAAMIADEYAEIDTCGPMAGWDIAARIRNLIKED